MPRKATKIDDDEDETPRKSSRTATRLDRSLWLRTSSREDDVGGVARMLDLQPVLVLDQHSALQTARLRPHDIVIHKVRSDIFENQIFKVGRRHPSYSGRHRYKN